MATEALLLELEGVLVETEPHWRSALEAALAAHGIEVDDDAVRSGGGRPLGARVDRLLAAAGAGGDHTMRDILVLDAGRRFAESLRGGLSLVPGARELLRHARARARVAAVTRARRATAGMMLEIAGVEALVEFVIASEDAAEKPSPAGYERALSRLARGGSPSRARVIALEDHSSGAAAARAAGLACVLVGAAGPASIATLEGYDLAALERLVGRAS